MHTENQKSDDEQYLEAILKEGTTDELKRYFKEHCVDLNAMLIGERPLIQYAIAHLSVASMEVLCHAGLDLHHKNPEALEQKNALHYALELGRAEMASFLLEKGLCLDTGADHSDRPIFWLGIASKMSKSIIERLIDMSSNEMIHKTDEDQYDSLHIAALFSRDDIVQILIQKGASLSARTNRGDTALHVACRNKHINTIKVLVHSGSDLESKNDGGHRPVDIIAPSDTAAVFLREVMNVKQEREYLDRVTKEPLLEENTTHGECVEKESKKGWRL